MWDLEDDEGCRGRAASQRDEAVLMSMIRMPTTEAVFILINVSMCSILGNTMEGTHVAGGYIGL